MKLFGFEKSQPKVWRGVGTFNDASVVSYSRKSQCIAHLVAEQFVSSIGFKFVFYGCRDRQGNETGTGGEVVKTCQNYCGISNRVLQTILRVPVLRDSF